MREGERSAQRACDSGQAAAWRAARVIHHAPGCGRRRRSTICARAGTASSALRVVDLCRTPSRKCTPSRQAPLRRK